jgi:serine phosphatase RsbU (regulator of sigma subunit)
MFGKLSLVRNNLFVFVLALLCCNAKQARGQSTPFTDSIFAIIYAMPDDTAKARYITNIYESDLWAYNLPEAYNQLKLAARIGEQYKADTLLYKIYHSMGGFCVRANANEYALQHRKKQMEIVQAWHDTTRIALMWGAMAMSYAGLSQYDLAIACYHKALPTIAKNGSIETLGRMHTFLGWAFQANDQIDSAKYYCELGFAERREAKFLQGMYATGNSLLGMYFDDSNFVRVREIIDILVYATDSSINGPSREGFITWYGAMHEKQGNFDSAYYYYMRGLKAQTAVHNIGMMMGIYKQLATVLSKMGRTGEAYDYLLKHTHLKDSIRDWETKNNLARQREIYDVESKNAEIEKLQEETMLHEIESAEKDKQRLWLAIVLGVTTVLVFVAFLAYRQKRKSAILLKQQNAIIEEKNHDITDSIQYAKRIQQAILPSMEQIKAALPDSFVFFSPKDIVSGDFFWFSETPKAYFIAVVDCTGHGVPGAMMSMIGYNYLGQIVNEQDVDSPVEILNELHRKVILALNKDYTSRQMKDGMDVALLRIDKKTKQILFAGAVRPLYVVTNGGLTEIKGDLYSIGGIKDVNTQTFTQHEVNAPAGSCIYLFSDGYADQFGGPGGKKFKYKNLRALLMKNAPLPMEQQRADIEKTFHAWRAELEQVDDVCLVGLRV